jgi:hypothetical protein
MLTVMMSAMPVGRISLDILKALMIQTRQSSGVRQSTACATGRPETTGSQGGTRETIMYARCTDLEGVNQDIFTLAAIQLAFLSRVVVVGILESTAPVKA